jgi:hypothetical protein
MRLILLATIAALALAAAPAHALPIVQFSQTSNADTITATDNGASTTISGSNVAVNVSQDIGGYLGSALLDLTATSVDTAVAAGSAVIQHFSGSFQLLEPGGAANILSGSFTDAAIGAGPALGLVIGAPPDALSLTSSIIPAADLVPPLGLSFSFTNVSPNVHIDGQTLAAFKSTVAGNASGEQAVPEPASLGLLGAGLVALGLVRRNRQSSTFA